jgi:hypothetical protein
MRDVEIIEALKGLRVVFIGGPMDGRAVEYDGIITESYLYPPGEPASVAWAKEIEGPPVDGTHRVCVWVDGLPGHYEPQ